MPLLATQKVFVQMPIQHNGATVDVQMLLQRVIGTHQNPLSAGLVLGELLWGAQTQGLLPLALTLGLMLDALSHQPALTMALQPKDLGEGLRPIALEVLLPAALLQTTDLLGY